MKTVAIVCKLADGSFIDPFSGSPIGCIAEGVGVEALVAKYKELRSSGVIAGKKKGEEIRLSDLHMIGTGVEGGVFKSRKRFG